jgi:2-polyprenyl-3-methyl-5-hydroxy-6-metoxy-1,4-benzoquinol methylase
MGPLLASFKGHDGEVHVSRPRPGDRLHLTIHTNESKTPAVCQSELSLKAVEYLVQKIDCTRLPDLLSRYEDHGMPAVLKTQLFSYFRPEEFSGKRLLDFGCGLGPSTIGLAKLLPETEIVGIDLVPERIEVAQTIAALEGFKNLRFLCSPAGDQLPDHIGQFEFVVLCAVYEHLLPSERRTVMRLLWSIMKPGAAIFVNQTPYRYFPYEHHSTGLWFINYMPDAMAHFVSRKFARNDPSKYDRQIQTSPDWETHLRGGIRGATEWEIIRYLTIGNNSKARIMQPRSDCVRDRADYWLVRTSKERFPWLKKIVAIIFRFTDRLLGTVPSLNLDVVVRKEPAIERNN